MRSEVAGRSGIALVVLLFFLGAARAEGPVRVTVIRNRVNLRARPKPEAEVAGQVNEGDLLEAHRTEGEWVEVTVPSHVDVWVHRDFVKDGIVQGSNLQVRAGPGINYPRVSVLQKGEQVEVRGSFGEWLKIGPPPNARVWIHKDYVRFPSADKIEPGRAAVETARPAAAAEEAEQRASATPPATRPVTPQPSLPVPRLEARPPSPSAPPAPPPEFRLAPVANQGRVVQREGYVQPVGYWFNRPSNYLLAHERVGRMETACYLWGNEKQLEALRGRRLIIEGREYWLQGVRHPMLVVDRIRMVSP